MGLCSLKPTSVSLAPSGRCLSIVNPRSRQRTGATMSCIIRMLILLYIINILHHITGEKSLLPLFHEEMVASPHLYLHSSFTSSDVRGHIYHNPPFSCCYMHSGFLRCGVSSFGSAYVIPLFLLDVVQYFGTRSNGLWSTSLADFAAAACDGRSSGASYVVNGFTS